MFLAVPDDSVLPTARLLAAAGKRIPESIAFVHLSGAMPLDALEPLRARHPIGSFHPLQSFPEPLPPASLRGIVVAVDASSPLLRRRLAGLARTLGARPRRVGDGDRVLYHAAAVFVSNYLDVLLSEGVQLLEAAGWSAKDATSGLLALAEGTLASVRKRGPVAALTGPVRRGDVTTVERHLSALSGLAAAAAWGSRSCGASSSATEDRSSCAMRRAGAVDRGHISYARPDRARDRSGGGP